MKKMYYIFDENSNDVCCLVYAKNEKSALKKYSNGLLTVGFYYILRENNQYFLVSTYGSRFSAIVCSNPEIMQKNQFLTVIK